MKKLFILIGLVIVAVTVSGCTTNTPSNTVTGNSNTAVINAGNHNTTSISNANAEVGNQNDVDKMCGWVDASDVIITLKFADGVAKDTSYEAGFYLSSINLFARVARQQCGYRTGFSYEELKGKGAVQVGVRGYTDSNRRQLQGDPISVVIGADGHPDIGSRIEVTVLD
ncbi:MAG: hypothetical protein WCT27_04515 [Patescibacteria group bacterium]